MSDRIVYLLVTNPGGIDGMDASDKGGRIVDASFEKSDIESALNGWYRLQTCVVDEDASKREALKKLSPVDRLVLGFPTGFTGRKRKQKIAKDS